MAPQIKQIGTQGITNITPLDGSCEWYWGTDYTGGDMYEAEELFKQGHPVDRNRLVLIHYPDGKLIQAVAEKGQYFGCPIFYNNKIITLMADFINEAIKIMQLDALSGQSTLIAAIPLSDVEDCYNLMLKASPLMLTRQGNDNKFQVLWPERAEFDIGNTESFCFKNGEYLYFSAWYEDPDYREEAIVRKSGTGEIIDRIPGSMWAMPDGQMWVLT